MVRQDILQKFPDLFGEKQVNGRALDVEETIAALTRELRPAIAAALTARRELLASPAPVREKYAWPWEASFEDPVSGKPFTFRQIVQGLVDNFLGKDTPLRWRLNDEVPIPAHVHPSRNPGLELTGPWSPLDMAFNALNSPAPMNMPDFEDAAPPHFRPDGTPATEPVGIFAALQNAKEIHEGRWNDRPYEVTKKGKKRAYRIAPPQAKWPTRLARPPSLHIQYEHVTVDGAPAPGLVVVTTLWALDNFDALRRAGSGVYFYIPKLQTPQEALLVERLLSRLEGLIGVPAGTIKVKMLYEEGNAGRQLPAIVWTLRRRLLGTNVGRWDYLGSLIEMWRDDPRGVFPDPQSIGMATPNMIAYQRYNALLMLMAGLKDGDFSHAAPIGGMAAVMIYQAGDPYGRSRYNPLALRAMVIDKLRERLLGLMFVPDAPLGGAAPTLADVLAGKVKGRLYDAYRQSWVASPEPDYVAAGNAPLQADVGALQGILDAPRATVDVKGKPVPTVASGLSDAERTLLQSRGLLDGQGRITPLVLERGTLDTPEKLLSGERWEAIYAVPKGDVTIEHVQHAFYMAANYGFQILNGNFAAAIDDYELKLRFMNDLATYRINVSWLWALCHHQAAITKDGHLQKHVLTEDGMVIGADAEPVKAGARFTRELFEKVWAYHDGWTKAFFAEQDRRGEPARFDRAKADVIMELLRKQLLSPRYIQHSARILFVVAEAKPQDRKGLLEAVFDLDRAEVAKRVKAGQLPAGALAAHDYVNDVFAGA
ncbi:malate synthase [Anaeromyxobacter diazotrophicus]|uniref:malate synthase n=1 Tax=Anaeromyxobacter diazotrophicus TaxID=2590199 RepID=A0A7I9VJF6_9BACT|nr:malate synthase [Anaeromyxobacter diazotrophicus]GEJ56495.1 malate synthase [Anaeromyxobacter diazotrophicus]